MLKPISCCAYPRRQMSAEAAVTAEVQSIPRPPHIGRPPEEEQCRDSTIWVRVILRKDADITGPHGS
ncbi:transketolase [Sarotherodon galilaeus]